MTGNDTTQKGKELEYIVENAISSTSFPISPFVTVLTVIQVTSCVCMYWLSYIIPKGI
jgi:hypothetical protein